MYIYIYIKECLYNPNYFWPSIQTVGLAHNGQFCY